LNLADGVGQVPPRSQYIYTELRDIKSQNAISFLLLFSIPTQVLAIRTILQLGGKMSPSKKKKHGIFSEMSENSRSYFMQVV